MNLYSLFVAVVGSALLLVTYHTIFRRGVNQMPTIPKFPGQLSPLRSDSGSWSEIMEESLFMEEAMEAWEGEGGALRRIGPRFLSASASGAEKLIAEKINTVTILTGEGAFLPESPQFDTEPHSNRWKLVQDSDGRGLNQRIHQAGRGFFYRVARPRTLWLLFLCLIAVVAGASAQTGSPVPTVETIVARMTQARAENEARLCPYIVTRDYQLFGKERDQTKSQVIADVIFLPPDLKNYAIQQANGLGLGERIVRRILASEAEIARDYVSTDFSLSNYAFRFIREEEVSGQRCYVLELLPRRKQKNLLHGNLWVDANTYLLRRSEGEPAKTPSWWVRDVRIALFYGEVGGMWLQTALEATATVRILGPYRMVSRDVKYKISELVAAK